MDNQHAATEHPPRLGGAAARRDQLRLAAAGLAVIALVLAAGGAPARSALAAPGCRDQIAVIPARTTWALQGDCTTDTPIVVPDGWTFDGQGATTRVVDPADRRFAGGVITRAGGTANVTKVTIDGSGLAEGCPENGEVTGVLFKQAVGTITDVTVVNLGRGRGAPCGSGITVEGAGDGIVDIQRNTIDRSGRGGIMIRAAAEATITENVINNVAQWGIMVYDKGTRVDVQGNTVANAGEISIAAAAGASVVVTNDNRVSGGKVGIRFTGSGTTGTVADNAIDNPTDTGILVMYGASVRVAGNQVTGGDVGIAFHGDIHGVIDDNVVQDPKRVGIMLFLWRIGGRAEATVTSNRVINAGEIGILLIADSGQVLHNTIVGPTPVDRTEHGPDGILFLGTEGRLAQNTVSGHFNDHPEGRACGIRLGADAGEIAVSGNHFPSPGNEVDLCDERASGAAAATPVATPVMGG